MASKVCATKSAQHPSPVGVSVPWPNQGSTGILMVERVECRYECIKKTAHGAEIGLLQDLMLAASMSTTNCVGWESRLGCWSMACEPRLSPTCFGPPRADRESKDGGAAEGGGRVEWLLEEWAAWGGTARGRCLRVVAANRRAPWLRSDHPEFGDSVERKMLGAGRSRNSIRSSCTS